MEEKRTCSNCGARLRPGARFCSGCGAIVRNNEPVAAEPVKVEKTTEPRKFTRQEFNVYEKLAQPEKKPEKKERKYKEYKKGFNIELAGHNTTLWSALTGSTSLVALVMGIVLMCLTFMSFSPAGYGRIALSMSDCINVLFNKDIPHIYEVVNAGLVSGLLSGIGVCGLIYLIVSIVYVLYNIIMYGKYNKLILLINTICSSVLTVLAIVILALYLSLQSKCSGTAFASISILLLIVTVIVLLFDVAKYTILYQPKVAEQNKDSYIIGFVTKLTHNLWKVLAIAGSAVGLIAIIVITLMATAKSPAIKLWEKYVDAYNDGNATTIASYYFASNRNEYDDTKERYEEIFVNKNSLEQGKAELVLRTEKYIKVKVINAKYNGKVIPQLDLHFNKVGSEWYLMSYIDFENKGNIVELNDFNKEVADSILKITETTVHGFSVKISSADQKAIKKIVIPEGVQIIKNGAFDGLTNLESVSIPNTVVKIEKEAFKGCAALKQVKMSTKLVELGNSAFEGCAALENVILASTTEKVGENAFKDCTSLSIYTYLSDNNIPVGFNETWNPNNCTVYLGSQWNNNIEKPNRYCLLTIESNGGEYELVGDEFFKPGEYAEVKNPTKLGCEFLGWYTSPNFEESSKIGLDPTVPLTVQMQSDLTIYAKWDENTYKIEYVLNGGTLASKVETYTVGDEIVLTEPTLRGHTFNGWYTSADFEGEKVDRIKKGTTGNLKFYAKFVANMYTLTLDANGGKYNNTTKNEVVATFGQNVQISKLGFSYSGMELVGWNTEKDGSGTSYQPTQVIEYTEAKNVTLYAVWSSLITLEPGNNASYEGDIPRITIGQKEYTLPVPTSTENVFFAGWFLGDEQITNDQGEGLRFWKYEEKVTLTAKWVNEIEIDGVKYIYRGEYPQTRVTDTTLHNALNKIKTTNERGYIEYDGAEYAKVVYNNATTKAVFNDGTKLKHGSTYFFKVEKILWRVLDETKLLLISDLVLDAIAYYDDNENRVFDDPAITGGRLVSPSNYVFSNLNAWLNNDKIDRMNLVEDKPEVSYIKNGFATKAFGDDPSQYIQWTLDIDNSAASTANPNNPYVWGNSEAFFFALSYKEKESDYAQQLAGGKAGATDYAIAKEVEFDLEKGGACWWLRSPYHDSPKYALYVNASGNLGWKLVTDATIGVRPAMYLRPGK